MAVYAVLSAPGNNGVQTIENTIVADQAFIDAAYPGAVEIDTVPGSPGVGHSTSDGGKTWSAPSAAPDPLAPAQQTISTLLAEQPSLATQIQSDASLFANTTPGSPITQQHIDAFGRMVKGFGTVMQAIQAHLVLTGDASPQGA